MCVVAPNTSETFDKRSAQTQRVIECTNSELHASRSASPSSSPSSLFPAAPSKVRDDVVDAVVYVYVCVWFAAAPTTFHWYYYRAKLHISRAHTHTHTRTAKTTAAVQTRPWLFVDRVCFCVRPPNRDVMRRERIFQQNPPPTTAQGLRAYTHTRTCVLVCACHVLPRAPL